MSDSLHVGIPRAQVGLLERLLEPRRVGEVHAEVAGLQCKRAENWPVHAQPAGCGAAATATARCASARAGVATAVCLCRVAVAARGRRLCCCSCRCGSAGAAVVCAGLEALPEGARHIVALNNRIGAACPHLRKRLTIWLPDHSAAGQQDGLVYAKASTDGQNVKDSFKVFPHTLDTCHLTTPQSHFPAPATPHTLAAQLRSINTPHLRHSPFPQRFRAGQPHPNVHTHSAATLHTPHPTPCTPRTLSLPGERATVMLPRTVGSSVMVVPLRSKKLMS
eukprot:365204-Chlamydomonas_euryale.AAC.3